MTRRHREDRNHVTRTDLRSQLEQQFRVLWARGFRTSFSSKTETLDRVAEHLFPKGTMDRVVRIVIEGAQHNQYQLRTVRKLVQADFGGKSKLLLTGVLDVVIEQEGALSYAQTWEWTDRPHLQGKTGRTQLIRLPAISETGISRRRSLRRPTERLVRNC